MGTNIFGGTNETKIIPHFFLMGAIAIDLELDWMGLGKAAVLSLQYWRAFCSVNVSRGFIARSRQQRDTEILCLAQAVLRVSHNTHIITSEPVERWVSKTSWRIWSSGVAIYHQFTHHPPLTKRLQVVECFCWKKSSSNLEKSERVWVVSVPFSSLLPLSVPLIIFLSPSSSDSDFFSFFFWPTLFFSALC